MRKLEETTERQFDLTHYVAQENWLSEASLGEARATIFNH